jgi:hypothetical protein
MARGEKKEEPTIVEIDAMLKKLNETQLRTLILLIVSGNSFVDAHAVVASSSTE